MEISTDVREAYVRFCDRLSAGDVTSFDDLVSPDAVLIVGTAPGELVRERAQMRYGFEAEGIRLEPTNPEAYAEGSLAWVSDEPTFFFPDGLGMSTRLTAVLRHEGGMWKLVHAHFSVGVPDEEVIGLQRRWRSEAEARLEAET